MAICSICKKKIVFFNRHYHCLYCGKSLCSDCIRTTKYTSDEGYAMELIDIPFVDSILSNSFLSTRKDVVCSSCYKSRYTPELNRVQRAISLSNSVELVSKNYKGHKAITDTGIAIESRWHRDWNDCDDDLKILARYYDCDIVMNVDRDRDTESWQENKDNGNGTYTRTRTIWKKTGIAYKLCRSKK